MKAVKANKEYSITEAEKKGYIDQGFDIINDDGTMLAYGRGKTVPYDEYMKLVKELEELKAADGNEDTGKDEVLKSTKGKTIKDE